MVVPSEQRQETMQLIKQAIYDLQVGPSEILFSGENPEIYSVKFDSSKGKPQEIVVPVLSTYSFIYAALRSGYNSN
jgi:hypothetical protein